MATMLFDLSVEMEGEAPYQVVADQRDVARWEMQSFGWPVSQLEANVSMAFFRFLGWSAGVRAGRTTDTYEVWDKKAIEVMPIEDEESELPADAADPGQTGAQDKPSSDSHGSAGKRSRKS